MSYSLFYCPSNYLFQLVNYIYMSPTYLLLCCRQWHLPPALPLQRSPGSSLHRRAAGIEGKPAVRLPHHSAGGHAGAGGHQRLHLHHPPGAARPVERLRGKVFVNGAGLLRGDIKVPRGTIQVRTLGRAG